MNHRMSGGLIKHVLWTIAGGSDSFQRLFPGCDGDFRRNFFPGRPLIAESHDFRLERLWILGTISR